MKVVGILITYPVKQQHGTQTIKMVTYTSATNTKEFKTNTQMSRTSRWLQFIQGKWVWDEATIDIKQLSHGGIMVCIPTQKENRYDFAARGWQLASRRRLLLTACSHAHLKRCNEMDITGRKIGTVGRTAYNLPVRSAVRGQLFPSVWTTEDKPGYNRFAADADVKHAANSDFFFS
jgi:hypothetical protein